ncbi:PREDICTED: germin-like protein subfamily 1 member 11 [Brassica oleracea var. oleracea]|uniref:germin-like protein subfamily 1 member 11 n=1 Tax=Brassica oleracea var. oleracea TaxID=109376 RepID=UPI0006A6BFBE|nr:PREDICTED: germin-like protein subfamily 1 member 11 [Brassica oleracea var. oleracea]
MAMKNLSFLAVLSLLALTLPLAIASDPSPLQDFCVGVNTPSDGVFVNGKFCKDPKLVTVDDFFMAGLQNARPVANVVGSNVTAVNVNNLPGLNTLGISLVRIDYGVNGQNPPHTHPRATEILYVGHGKLLVGFVTSNGDGNRLFTKTLNEGDVFVFPEGLICYELTIIHFQFNVGRFPAFALAALSSQNPGVVTIANSVFGSNPAIDPNVLARAFQLDPKVIMDLQAKF